MYTYIPSSMDLSSTPPPGSSQSPKLSFPTDKIKPHANTIKIDFPHWHRVEGWGFIAPKQLLLWMSSCGFFSEFVQTLQTGSLTVVSPGVGVFLSSLRCWEPAILLLPQAIYLWKSSCLRKWGYLVTKRPCPWPYLITLFWKNCLVSVRQPYTLMVFGELFTIFP